MSPTPRTVLTPQFATLLLIFPLALAAQAPAASTPAAPAPARLTCPIVQPKPDTEADIALHKRDFAAAESLFRTAATAAADEPSFADATFGLVRALIQENKGHDAVDAANAALKRYPNNSVLLDSLGSAYFYRGETNQAGKAWNAAQDADFCNPHVHYDMASFLHLNAEYASEQRQLDTAHQIAPKDPTYARAVGVAGRNETEEQTIARLSQRLEGSELSADAKAGLQRTIDLLKVQSKGTCEVVNPLPATQIPILPIANGPRDMYAAGLELSLNGKKRRFELDTGASGLLISRSVAQAAGLISEAQSSAYGIGDGGDKADLLAHVDDIKIGELEFHNCLVRILEQKSSLEIDGLIGPDVFSSYLVTIDTPGRVLRLSPLPPRPGDDKTTATLDTSGANPQDRFTPRNRYVAPEMATWTRVFRSGHDLIFPTNINGGPTRLFVLDTGASGQGLISIEAAREVTGVVSSDVDIAGISGHVKNVKSADELTLSFGGIRYKLKDVPAIDLSRFTRSAGVEISGFIGFNVLREVILSIDYRDSLVHVVYDPAHGFHRH